MLGVGKCWEILLESDGNTPFIPICSAEMGPKSFVPKSSAEMMSPYFWVVAMTVVPEKLMFCAGVSSCGCPCLNLVDAVTGHSFLLSPVLSLHSHSSSQCHAVVSAALLLFCPPCTACTWFCASASERQREKVSMFTPAMHFTSKCLPEDLCSVPTRTCHRVKRGL